MVPALAPRARPARPELDATQTRAWIEPALTNPEIRRDAVRFLRAAKPGRTCSTCRHFDGPVRVVWGGADKAFKTSLGKRLQQAFRDAEFIEVPTARTFVQLDAPELLADQIATFTGSHPIR